MPFNPSFDRPARSPLKVWALRVAVLSAASAAVVGTVISQTALPPLVNLPSEPLFMNGAKSKANLTLALSVEFPTVGQTYRDTFDKAKVYVGYFDPNSCYNHVPGSGTKGAFFDWSGSPNASGSCGGGGFNGNFLNWATSSAIDIMRLGLTGGNRTTDESTGNGLTIVERAWLPDNFYRSASFFSEKVLPKALVPEMVETAAANKIGDNDMYIYNCRDRVYFAKKRDTTGGCTNPFGVANAGSSDLVGPNPGTPFYSVRGVVCDPNSATNRLMTFNATTKKWSGLCWRYPNGKFKPVGQIQMNAENLQISVFGYLQDDSRSRYGGVMRAPLKYLGPKAFDANFNLLPGTNPRSEWDSNTGVFIDNPQNGDATYGAQGFSKSGAIMYINKFGTLDPNNVGKYKTLDPVSELYYEALRYLQGKQPTPDAVSGTSGSTATVTTLKENFPVYSNWVDPFSSFEDATGSGKSCLRNSILTIADVFTHSDRSVPGNTNTTNQDFNRAAETNPALDVPFWTGVVGSFEANLGTAYTDSQGVTQSASNILVNAPYYPTLANAATANTGATGGSYYLAGMAYWANTQSFRTDTPKARVTTYAIDVNERRDSDNVDFRRTRQLYLAAKYGGFDDSQANNSGNPYANGNNLLWQASDGDAKNYFLVSDAQKFLDSIADVFAKVVEETGSIAGGAISTQRLTAGQVEAVFQARFNPVANFWSGRVLKFPLSLSPVDDSLVIGSTPTWEAGSVLTAATGVDFGASRNIVIGSPLGMQGTVDPAPFIWADLPQAHKDALNTSLSGTTDTLGIDRLAYLRGDQRKEVSTVNPTAPFRPRDIVLGSVVNSGLVFQGTPTQTIGGSDYLTFFNANKSRRSTIFVNANDGMLHAFYSDTGGEAFAYIPGFLSSKLSALPDQSYSHISLADATPAVSEAFAGGKWRSVLVSGVGAGSQGIYALDVTNPASFTKDSVLWEFTDRDHPAMGNVIGTPQILKMRTNAASATTPTYKWYAVVASGVNNYAPDGFANTNANPSLFILDLSAKPTPTAPWTEGANFWRIELPQTSTAIAKGLIGFSTVKNFATGAVDTIYTGDMQGNVWKLDFSVNGTSTLGADGPTNLVNFNALGASKPLFVATASNGALQPITNEPAVVNAFGGNRLVSVGTGKFLESIDTSVPLAVTASFYSLLDLSQPVVGRNVMQAGTISSAGTVTVPTFIYGSPTVASPNLKMGWYVDFDATRGERQVSDITAAFGQLFFGSLSPTRGACGEGGGRFFALNALTGNGTAVESEVGILAAPLILEIGDTLLTQSDTAGQRTATQRLAIITQGSRGMKISTPPIGTAYSYSFQTGRLTWRQINNYQQNKNE